MVEVALALGVAAFCLVSIFGLVPIGVNTNRASFEQTSAANVASAVAADLRAVPITPSTAQTTPFYQIPIPATPTGSATNFTTLYVRGNGAPSGTISQYDSSQVPHYRVTIYFTATGTVGTSLVGNPNATAARILVTWPAQADADPTKAPKQFSGSFETFTGLVATN